MNLKSIVQKAVVCVATAAILGAAPVASADSLVTQGYANGSQQFGLTIGGSPNVGGFKGTWNGTAIIFWCIELTQYYTPGQTYTDYTASYSNSALMSALGQLFHEVTDGGGSPTSSTERSAAFQLAIWELFYDFGSPLSLAGGNFAIPNDFNHPGTVALAQMWLNNLGNFTDTFDLIVLTSAEHQNFLTFGRPFQYLIVPEPASLMLLGAAFLAMVLVLRRRPRRIAV